MPPCFVRIDAAHFIKPYASLVKNFKSKKIRIFYKAAIGLLIGARSTSTATQISKAILLSAKCEDDEKGTQCYEMRQWVISQLNPSQIEEPNLEENNPEMREKQLVDDSIFEDFEYSNTWFEWAKAIDKECETISLLENKDEHVNAYKCPELCKKLVSDLRWINLWSNICIAKFGYGRDAASSSPVESEFKNLKHSLKTGQPSRLRPDEFIDIHINHWIKGRINMIGAKEEALMFKENEETTINNDSSLVPDKGIHIKKIENKLPNDICTTSENGQSDENELKDTTICKICGAVADATLNSTTTSLGEQVCKLCQKVDSIPIILGSRKVENWRGLIVGEETIKKKTSEK